LGGKPNFRLAQKVSNVREVLKNGQLMIFEKSTGRWSEKTSNKYFATFSKEMFILK
jgi:hypothetical protein